MIDWPNLIYNALWILALAIALAVVSWASWQASVRRTALRAELAAPGLQRGLQLSGILFSLGMALTAETGYEKALWFLAGVYFLYRIAASFYGPNPKDI